MKNGCNYEEKNLKTFSKYFLSSIIIDESKHNDQNALHNILLTD